MGSESWLRARIAKGVRRSGTHLASRTYTSEHSEERSDEITRYVTMHKVLSSTTRSMATLRLPSNVRLSTTQRRKRGAPGDASSGSGAWIRTRDLRVMSPTSCLCSTPQRRTHYTPFPALVKRIAPIPATFVYETWCSLTPSAPSLDTRPGAGPTRTEHATRSARQGRISPPSPTPTLHAPRIKPRQYTPGA
jgi:hypothetical protein